jgi:hypothetical protein
MQLWPALLLISLLVGLGWKNSGQEVAAATVLGRQVGGDHSSSNSQRIGQNHHGQLFLSSIQEQQPQQQQRFRRGVQSLHSCQNRLTEVIITTCQQAGRLTLWDRPRRSEHMQRRIRAFKALMTGHEQRDSDQNQTIDILGGRGYIQRRSTRDVPSNAVDECCKNYCTVNQLLKYCHHFTAR